MKIKLAITTFLITASFSVMATQELAPENNNGQTVNIQADNGTCRNVTNNTGSAIYVPIKTISEL